MKAVRSSRKPNDGRPPGRGRAAIALVLPLLVALSLLVVLGLVGCASVGTETRGEALEQRASIYETYTRAQLARHLGDLEEAIEWARLGVEQAPAEGELVLLLGELLRLDSRYGQAIEVLTDGAERVADPVPLYLERATVEELASDIVAADGSYQEALAIAPDSLTAVQQYAEFAGRVRSRDRATDIVETYLIRQPDDPEGWRLLGGIQAEAGLSGRALESYARAGDVGDRSEDDFVPMLRLARDEGNWALADELAEECFSTFRQNIGCRVEYIRALDARELDADAREARTYEVLQHLGRVIGANVGHLRYVERRLASELDPERALTFLEAVAADRPRNSQIQARTAWAAYRVGDEDLACEYMARVLDVNPRSADALNFIGYSYAERGIRLDEAEELVQRALDVRPNDGNIQDSLGWVYYRAGRFAEAVEWLERAVSNIPDNAVLRDHLADAYRGLGDYNSALKQYLFARSLADEELRESIQAKIEEIEAALTS